jgi:Amt family ammonium transporter
MAIGAIGGIVYIFAGIFMHRFKIDDPVEATQVHAFCGIWGCLAQGIFDLKKGLIYTADFK